jgi:hypothetical protein
MSSRSVWSSVIGDLLLVTPNAHLHQSLTNLTADNLRQLALKYITGTRCLAITDEDKAPTHTFKMSSTVLDLELVSGTPFAIWVSTTAAVYLMNVQTGQTVSSWEPSQPVHLAYQADVEFWNSEEHACLFLVSLAIIKAPG